MQRLRWPLIVGGPLLAVLIVGYFMLTSGRSETTDDAYVQVAKAAVAPSIGGRVVEVYVRENQKVTRGQPLFRLDPRDLQASADAAAAAVTDAEQAIRSRQAAYQQRLAGVQAAQNALAYANTEATRQRNLLAAGVASQQEVDRAAQAATQARDQLNIAQQQAAQALADLGGAGGSPPGVQQARAQLERARLNLSYTTVVAPADGIVTRVEQLPVGSYVNPSQTVFFLLSGRPWVEANFKENQLGHMRVGQPVTIKIDAYEGETLTGRVSSFSPGTGAAFSPLPAQNATGNWVKVVQRLPVRVDFDKPPPDMAARAGLSAKVTVDLRGGGH